MEVIVVALAATEEEEPSSSPLAGALTGESARNSYIFDDAAPNDEPLSSVPPIRKSLLRNAGIAPADARATPASLCFVQFPLLLSVQASFLIAPSVSFPNPNTMRSLLTP